VTEELDNLQYAAEFLKGLPDEEDAVAERSLGVLAEEGKLFEECMLLQVAAIEGVMCGSPITDDGLRGALALANWVFGQLRCGWLALLKGYYAAASHVVRDIEQATVTQVAVTLDANIARRFWEEDLKDEEAMRIYWAALGKEDADDAEVRGEARKNLRKMLHSFVHPQRAAVAMSLLMSQDKQYATPVPGCFFAEEDCRFLGKIYVMFAFYAALQTDKAFERILPADGEWERRLKRVITEYESLSEKWSCEVEPT